MGIVAFMVAPLIGMIAYRNAHIEKSIITENQFGSGERLARGTVDYAQKIQALPGAHIKDELQPFIERMRIRKDVVILEKRDVKFCSWEGANSFTQRDAVIYVHPDFYASDREACLGQIKIAMMHIKNNDDVRIPLITAICSLAFAILFTFVVPAPSPLSATLVMTGLVFLATGFSCKNTAYSSVRRSVIKENEMDQLEGLRRFDVVHQCLQHRDNSHALEHLRAQEPAEIARVNNLRAFMQRVEADQQDRKNVVVRKMNVIWAQLTDVFPSLLKTFTDNFDFVHFPWIRYLISIVLLDT